MIVKESSAVCFKGYDAFQILMVSQQDGGLIAAVSRYINDPRFWPSSLGLYIVHFVAVDDGSWSFGGGARPSIHELAQIYDGTWTGGK